MNVNTQIRKLKIQNYDIQDTPSRYWTNPFYTPGTNKLLFSILNEGEVSETVLTRKAGFSSYKTPTLQQKQTIEQQLPSPLVSSVPPDTITTPLPEEDPSFSPSASFYQNEVYKSPGSRLLYTKDQEYYPDYSDDRSMVVYNPKTDNLFVVMRGTDPSAWEDWVSDVNIAYQYEKNRVGEVVKMNPKTSSAILTLGEALVTILAPGEVAGERAILAEAMAIHKSTGDMSEIFDKIQLKKHIDFIDEILDAFGKDINLKLVGHSKAGSEAQLMNAYLKGQLPNNKPKIVPKDIKVYLYNSLPYYWDQEYTDPDVYPVRTSTDPVSNASAVVGEHPHMRTIDTDKAGTKFTEYYNPLYSHRSEHFVKRDYRNFPMLINKPGSLRIADKGGDFFGKFSYAY